jgi:hypothetical protein
VSGQDVASRIYGQMLTASTSSMKEGDCQMGVAPVVSTRCFPAGVELARSMRSSRLGAPTSTATFQASSLPTSLLPFAPSSRTLSHAAVNGSASDEPAMSRLGATGAAAGGQLPEVTVGARVEVTAGAGIVRWMGANPAFAAGKWVGVELCVTNFVLL